MQSIDLENGIFINIPVLNESETILKVLTRIKKKLMGISHTVYIFDDGSTDGTIEKIERFSADYKNIKLFKNNKTDSGCKRGRALKMSLRWGLQNTCHDIFVEMDADLSHDPNELLSGIKLLDQYDVVIASKYMPGGKILSRNNLRKLISKSCTFFYRCFINIPISDFTNGYRFYTRKAAIVLSSQETKCSSPVYLTEALYLWSKNNLSLGEIPSTYYGRPHGKSKVTYFDFIKCFFEICDLLYRIKTGKF